MPDCLTNESLRQELIEYCGTFGTLTYCCCAKENTSPGFIMEVGLDFVRLSGPGNFTKNIYIPLNRFVTFRAQSNPAPTAPPGNCSSLRTLRKALNEDLCGNRIEVTYCNCSNTSKETGLLNEIGTNFLEIRFAGNDPDDVHDTSYHDLVINLCNVCAVKGPDEE